ncbi:MAG: saccharopine dehydrogenase family protein [Candidatus Aenigmatarchaeota archaeon]
MKVLVLGAGHVGQAVIHDMAEDHEVSAGDIYTENLESVEKFAETFQLNVKNKEETVAKMEEHDVVVGVLPGDLGFEAVKSAVEAGTDMVDVSFMPEDPFSLHEEAKKKDVSVVVDAGFGPGISNVFMGRIEEEMDHLEDVMIRIGGLPLDPEPPLYYKLTWSPYDLIEEYVREARIIRDGEVVEVDPFEEINEVELAGKEFEEFYSDGLRTLLKTIDAETMEETTLRWKGHLERMKVLRELGFFEKKNLDRTLEVIKPLMEFDSKDFCIMDVKAKGKENGDKAEMNYFFYDEADENFSSMARSTGFAASAFTKLLIQEKEKIDSGIIPPERLGRRKEHHDFMVKELRDRGINIEIDKG